jgi:hypothetical protein
MKQGGLPYQLYFVAMIIGDKNDRIYYVDPIHNTIHIIASPSPSPSLSSSSHQLSNIDFKDFQILNKSQLDLDLLHSTQNIPSLSICNDLVLLTSKTPQYDVVGNYKACFVSLLTKYNLLQKFSRKGSNPYRGLNDDPFVTGEKKIPCPGNLHRLWFHNYNPFSCVTPTSQGQVRKRPT